MNGNNGMSGLIPPFFARWDKGLRWCDVFQKKAHLFSIPQSGWGHGWKVGETINARLTGAEPVGGASELKR